MLKTAAALGASLAATGLLWGWTSHQFDFNTRKTTARIEYVQRHQNDALRTIICYFEDRTIRSHQLPPKKKLQGIRVLEHALHRAHLAPCNLT